MKKIISFVLAAVLLVSAVPTTLATNDYTAGTRVEYTASGSESYTITVPAQLAPGSSGTVTLQGTWAKNRIVTVTAEPTVTLTNSIKSTDQKVLDVTFAGISEAGSNTGSQTFTESVSVADIANALFGTWSGKFNYNVDIEDTANTSLRFGEKYICTTLVDKVWISTNFGKYVIFYEDGTVEFEGFELASGYTYTDTEISWPREGHRLLISNEGKTITFVAWDEVHAIFTLESEIQGPLTPLRFGEKYVRTSVEGGYESLPTEIVGYADGSATITTNGQSMTLPAGTLAFDETKVIVADTTYGFGYYIVSGDGSVAVHYNDDRTEIATYVISTLLDS